MAIGSANQPDHQRSGSALAGDRAGAFESRFTAPVTVTTPPGTTTPPPVTTPLGNTTERPNTTKARLTISGVR